MNSQSCFAPLPSRIIMRAAGVCCRISTKTSEASRVWRRILKKGSSKLTWGLNKQQLCVALRSPSAEPVCFKGIDCIFPFHARTHSTGLPELFYDVPLSYISCVTPRSTAGSCTSRGLRIDMSRVTMWISIHPLLSNRICFKAATCVRVFLFRTRQRDSFYHDTKPCTSGASPNPQLPESRAQLQTDADV